MSQLHIENISRRHKLLRAFGYGPYGWRAWYAQQVPSSEQAWKIAVRARTANDAAFRRHKRIHNGILDLAQACHRLGDRLGHAPKRQLAREWRTSNRA